MLRAPAGRQNESSQRREGRFQKGIVDISAKVAAVERPGIRYVERRTAGKPEGQVRIREEQLPEGDEVRASVREHLHRATAVVMSVHDIRTIPQIT